MAGWHIIKNSKPIPSRSFDWDYWHEDYDGENGLSGTASSVKDALQQISEIEEELEQC